MKIIATWIHLDLEGEESEYPQVKGISSDTKFQETYWRCAVVFFATSLMFNKNCHHILFTNAKSFPTIKGLDILDFLNERNIEVIHVENSYRVPSGYHKSWNNQFYEFSIIDFLAKHFQSEYTLLLLDSDCIFNDSIENLFENLNADSSLAFTYDAGYEEDYEINGLSRAEMGEVFAELGLRLDETPRYSGGEVLIAKKQFVDLVSADFKQIWSDQLLRHKTGRLKFNEEAHVLSYYYHKFNCSIGKLNNTIKRCWTNPFEMRNIVSGDIELPILHLPAEKNHGLKSLFNNFVNDRSWFSNYERKSFRSSVKRLLSKRNYLFKIRDPNDLLKYIRSS